jgi:hypothetical protein
VKSATHLLLGVANASVSNDFGFSFLIDFRRDKQDQLFPSVRCKNMGVVHGHSSLAGKVRSSLGKSDT